MPDGTPSLALSLHSSIHDIPAREWDVCAGPGNPFVSHAFLSAIEDSGSAGKRTGWLPRHAALRDQAGRLLATAPMYAKSHSYGEYVFDHGWARAFDQAGGDYYPKLQIAAPFSPVPGPRLLIRPDVDLPIAVLAGGLADTCAELGLSSVHATFCTETEYTALGAVGWLQRLGIQYHWYNQGFSSFDDFLTALNARKRKSIKRERRDAQSAGLEFHTLHGPDITAAQWKAFYTFYESTVDRKWGSAYLTEKFFPLLGERLGERVVLMLATQAGKPVAGALNLAGSAALYGRNWGCLGDFPFLHFELCYYRAIDYAIAHGLQRVEAGAQGEHKIQRGYLPSLTYSAHWINHRGLRRAIADFLDQERPARLREMAALADYSPFKQEERVARNEA
jgi:predicted N-acyltransferase